MAITCNLYCRAVYWKQWKQIVFNKIVQLHFPTRRVLLACAKYFLVQKAFGLHANFKLWFVNIFRISYVNFSRSSDDKVNLYIRTSFQLCIWYKLKCIVRSTFCCCLQFRPINKESNEINNKINWFRPWIFCQWMTGLEQFCLRSPLYSCTQFR